MAKVGLPYSFYIMCIRVCGVSLFRVGRSMNVIGLNFVGCSLLTN